MNIKNLFAISELYKTCENKKYLEKIIFNDLNNSIELLYFINKEFSYSYLSYDNKFTEFLSNILNRIHPDKDEVARTLYRILIKIQKNNPSQSVLDCAISLHKEYGFCIFDISDMIKQRSELRYAITQNFKNKKMFKDSFLLSYITDDIDKLKW